MSSFWPSFLQEVNGLVLASSIRCGKLFLDFHRARFRHILITLKSRLQQDVI
jgi:hypothetical protein